MLVLSRKVDQTVEISHPDIPGGKIIVMWCGLSACRGGQGRLGFTADRSIKILRTELAQLDAKEGPPLASRIRPPH